MRTSIANRIFLLALLVFAACDKTETTTPNPPANTAGENYPSIESFYAKIAVPTQKYTIGTEADASFTTPQGTIVKIPANCFVDANGNPVTGNVTVEFKDLYQKSDMLFSKMPTTTIYGTPLKSAGEFFIRVKQGNTTLQTANVITVQQPLNGLPFDPNMAPFIAVTDSMKKGKAWQPQKFDSSNSPGQYVFKLYRFSSPLDSGTWCNSDNSSFFSSYTQTKLTLHQTDIADSFHTDVFLLFKGVRSMIHVYKGSGNDFPYSYAPQGMECTLVAAGVRGGKLYSAFVPITISANQTVNFTLKQTTSDDFERAVRALN